jgi:kynureninase
VSAAQTNPLAAYYTRFRVAERLLLTGHSHQAWPDVALEGVTEAFADAARYVDDKWERAFLKAERVRAGFRTLLGDPDAELALGASTHDLVIRFLSALPLRSRPRLITTDGEFHTLRRQLARLGEEWLEIVRVPSRPADTLAERLAALADARTAAVLVSAVRFEDARIVPGLDVLAGTCAARGIELLIDAYHALGAVPFLTPAPAWVVGGGYKYLQLGEGNCFMRVPAHMYDARPAVTGWFAEFEALPNARDPAHVAYPPGAAAFSGSTYDPTSHYRAARVLDFFVERELTATVLHARYRSQIALLASAFDALDLPEAVISRDRQTPPDQFGGFLALSSPHAPELSGALRELGVFTDIRGAFVRFGPAPYLSDTQLEEAIGFLGVAVARLLAGRR